MMAKKNWVIDVQHLCKSFGTKKAVIDLNLSIKKGEIYGFLGPNGSGKTTTIRMLCGLIAPDSGTGHCLGYDILTESSLIKKNIGYMTQKFSFYDDLTVFENLHFMARLYEIKKPKQHVVEIMQRFDLSDRANQLTGQLSGGWKQRVALAACMLHEPKLLLLDEPTAGVDPKARREFWDLIHNLSREGVTSLVSTHYMDEAERCTCLAYIAYGTLLVTGTTQQIIHKIGLLTWALSGENLNEANDFLAKEPCVTQLARFGQALHVSGMNAEALKEIIQKVGEKYSLQYEMVRGNLEDVFIHLVQEQQPYT